MWEVRGGTKTSRVLSPAALVLAISTNLNQLFYLIFSRKMPAIKHMHDWWSHFNSKAIEDARKTLLKLKLHGRRFILALSSCRHLLALSARPLPVVISLTPWGVWNKIYPHILCYGASVTCRICSKMVLLESCNSRILPFWMVLLGGLCPAPGLV